MLCIPVCLLYLIFLTFQAELFISASCVASHQGRAGRDVSRQCDQRTPSMDLYYY